jgi:hypothetical protein
MTAAELTRDILTRAPQQQARRAKAIPGTINPDPFPQVLKSSPKALDVQVKSKFQVKVSSHVNLDVT